VFASSWERARARFDAYKAQPKSLLQGNANRAQARSHTRSMKPIILIVEDEDAIAQTLTYALSTDGFAPMHVRTLAEARTALSREVPALIVLDVGLPDGSGFDLCRELRASTHRNASVPIMMLTARSEEVDRIVGLELGADDYVAKPFSPREVSLRVKTILRRATANAELEVARSKTLFRIDRDAQRILFSGQALSLAKREYLLLKTLLERPGRICSREMLLDTVWGLDAESGDRTVDTHVKTLRAKLKAIRDDLDPIETHRGMGYSISDNPM
jgi:two-component system, OmpR family, catabolic regulation response regulator CreB